MEIPQMFCVIIKHRRRRLGVGLSVKTEALCKSDGRSTEDPGCLGLHVILEYIS